MKTLTLLLNILYLKSCVSIYYPKNELQMIVDIAKSYDKPTAVVAKLCWKPAMVKINLAKMLANSEKSINFRYMRKNVTIKHLNVNNHLLFVIDMKCDTKLFLSQANANNMFSKSYRWLILNKPGCNEVIPPEFKNQSISVDSEVIMAREQENKDFILHASYKIKSTSGWNTEYYGTWSANIGLKKSDDMIKSNVMRRKDLKGEYLGTSLVIGDNSTKTDLLGLGNTLVDTLSKSSYRNTHPLYDFLNASKLLVFTDTWGYLFNGTWNGMIGDLINNKADLCGTVTFITTERLHVLEYLTHPTPITAKFVFRQPPLSYQNNLFLLPFTSSVWYSTGAFVLITTFILYINTKWDIKKYEEFNEQKIDQSFLSPTWSDITIFVLSAISQQGSSNELKGTLGRLVMFIVFLAFLFLYTSYSANIVVLLQSTSNQIRTLSDLLNSKLELGVEDVAYNRYYFSAAHIAGDPIREAIYETKIAPRGKPNFMRIEEGVKALQKKPFAFNMNMGTGYKIVSGLFQEHEKCGLQEIDFIQSNKPWLCCRKNSPYAEMFKVGYIRIQEHGLSDRGNRLLYAKKPVCSVMGGSFESVNMVDFYPVCLMLLYGMMIAFILLGIEILVHHRQKMKESAEWFLKDIDRISSI